jgi:hypothetical protein
MDNCIIHVIDILVQKKFRRALYIILCLVDIEFMNTLVLIYHSLYIADLLHLDYYDLALVLFDNLLFPT